MKNTGMKGMQDIKIGGENMENKKEPCKFRYGGICTKANSVWYGNKVDKKKCDKCKLYKK